MADCHHAKWIFLAEKVGVLYNKCWSDGAGKSLPADKIGVDIVQKWIDESMSVAH